MCFQAVRVGQNLTTTLPIQIGDTTIYRDADLLIIVSTKGFHLNCNLLFDVCWFELGGWYFGKTAGLLGNMNNEMLDDHYDQFGNLAFTQKTLIDSWAMNQSACESLTKMEDTTNNDNHKISAAEEQLMNVCESYFQSKLSFFANCFAVVNPLPFYDMCIDLGKIAQASVIKDAYPANKGLCSAALAYIESCAAEQTPLRLPDFCIQ